MNARENGRLLGGRLLVGLQVEGSGIDAVAQSRGGGAIREYVAKMSPTLAAQSLRAAHELTVVHGRGNRRLDHRAPETGPSGSGIELMIRVEQGVAAADAGIGACVVTVPVGARESGFGALLLSYAILLGRESGCQIRGISVGFGVVFFHLRFRDVADAG